jgi:hypothetical protein
VGRKEIALTGGVRTSAGESGHGRARDARPAAGLGPQHGAGKEKVVRPRKGEREWSWAAEWEGPSDSASSASRLQVPAGPKQQASRPKVREEGFPPFFYKSILNWILNSF